MINEHLSPQTESALVNLGWQANANLRFFRNELLKNHYSTFHRAALIAARGKLRRISGHNPADIENAFHDAGILALSGQSPNFAHKLCSRIGPLRRMTESITSTAGPQAAFEALESVLGPSGNVPKTLRKAREQARQCIGCFAWAVFNIVRTFMRDERRHRDLEMIAASNSGLVVVLGPDPGVQEDPVHGTGGDVVDDSQNPLDWAMRNQRIEEVRSALTHMKPNKAELLRLRYYEELSYQEIADATGMNPAIVGTMLARARNELLQQYQSLQKLAALGAATRLCQKHGLAG